VSHQADTADVEGSVTARRDGAILRLTIDRPSQRNSLNRLMIETLVGALTDAAADDSLRAIHLRGAGDHFCAGADWMATNSGDGQRPRTGDLVRRIPHAAHRLIELVHTIHLPVVCSVQGWAVGVGCNLALASDFAVAAADAVFWEPFIDRGFSPDSGSTWLLPRLVGVSRAMELLLSGRIFSGAEGAEIGLFARALPAEEVLPAAQEFARDLAASTSAVSVAATKALVYNGLGQDREESHAIEHQVFRWAGNQADAREGVTAFLEKRAPQWPLSKVKDYPPML